MLLLVPEGKQDEERQERHTRNAAHNTTNHLFLLRGKSTSIGTVGG
jgi:hypothetical protein